MPSCFAALEQEIERKENQVLGLALRQGCLKRRKVGRSVGVEGDDLTVDDAIRRLQRGIRNGAEFRRPIEPLADFQRDLSSSTRN
jgi:hypothetical protein